MTVAQDTVMCLGFGVAANLGASGGRALKAEAEKLSRNGFLASWVPFSTALLLAWPDWSWWYWEPVEGRVGVALVLALFLEVGAFFLGRRAARGLSPAAIGRVMLALALIYVVLLVYPWQWYSYVGTTEQFRAGATVRLWQHIPLLVTLVVGATWMFSILGLTVAKLWKMGAVSMTMLALAPLLLSGCGPSSEDVLAGRVRSAPPENFGPVQQVDVLKLAISHDAETIVRGWVTARHHDSGAAIPDLSVRDEGQAITALVDGRVDAAILHRPPNDAEESYSRGDGLVARTTLIWESMARCAVVLMVHPENPITTVPVDRALEMLSGEVRDWAQLGSYEGQVQLYAGERSASSYVAAEVFLDGLSFSERLQTMPSDKGVVRAVATDPLGLGLGSATNTGEVRVLGIKGTDGRRRMFLPREMGSPESMLARELYLITRGKLSPELKGLRDYAMSKAGVAIAELNSYVVEQAR